jgi:hypothetical protein
MVQIDPDMKWRIRQQNTEIADLIDKNDVRGVAQKLFDKDKEYKESQARKHAAIMRLNADPLDVEVRGNI